MSVSALPAQRFLCLAEESAEPPSPGRCSANGVIRQAWTDGGEVYGYRKLHDDLLDQGEASYPNRVAQLSRLAGIKAQIGYKRRRGN